MHEIAVNYHDTIDPNWPSDVGLIITALEASDWHSERRGLPRYPYRVKAVLRLFTDAPNQRDRLLYTRNINSRGTAFLSSQRFPLGYGGTVKLLTPRAKLLEVSCTILRCREAAQGWYEGALHFNRDQAEFDFPPANQA